MGAIAALAVLIVLVTAASGVAASYHKPQKQSGVTRHCGLFYSGVEWEDAPHIKGHYYAYGIGHMTPAGRLSPCLEGYRLASLALHGKRHPSGFTCTVSAPISSDEHANSGSCYKGSPRNRSKLQYVEWAPETNCAIPDPPYTPATLPSGCHS